MSSDLQDRRHWPSAIATTAQLCDPAAIRAASLHEALAVAERCGIENTPPPELHEEAFCNGYQQGVSAVASALSNLLCPATDNDEDEGE